MNATVGFGSHCPLKAHARFGPWPFESNYYRLYLISIDLGLFGGASNMLTLGGQRLSEMQQRLCRTSLDFSKPRNDNN